MNEEPIKFAPPPVGGEEIDAVVEAIRSDWLTTGPRVKEFEQRIAERLGVPTALAVNSGTAAMHLALLALGIGSGDIVLTTTMTFCSTVHVIEHVGATPVLVDVEADTLNIDPRALRSTIDRIAAGEPVPGYTPSPGDRLRAVMPVHYAGHPVDRDVLRIAEEHGLAVVEDAAHAIGSAWDEEPVGAFSGSVPRAVAFSFYATKNLAVGEGGALTGPPDLVDEARAWSLHGMNSDSWRRYADFGSWYYEVDRPGYKYNLPDPNAAMGLVQLRRLDEIKDHRRATAATYLREFDGLDLVLPVERPGVHSSWHLFPIRVGTDRPGARNDLIRFLGERGIGSSVHFIPVHRHPYYRDRYSLAADDFPVANAAYERLVSLPIHARLEPRHVDRIVTAVTDWVRTG